MTETIGLAPGVRTIQVPTPSLGDHSYVVLIGDIAAVIDPQRDIERMTDLIGSARVVAVIETHVHNDYVSGGPILAAATGATYVVPANSGVEMDHHSVADGDTVTLAPGWLLRALHTPGHTPHHTAYALEGPGGAVAVYTGGSMLAGAVGRTDLIGPEMTDELTHAQWHSVRRLAADLDDPVTVVPTHGAGSFCAASATTDTTSTIGDEKRHNPALVNDEDTFVKSQIGGFMLYPTYYAHMAGVNRVGATAIGAAPPELTPAELEASGSTLIDLRESAAFAAGHIAGSVNIPPRDTMGTYIDWVLPWNTAVVLIGNAETVAETRMQLALIGHDAVVGTVSDGLAAWREAGRGLVTSRVATFADLETAPDDAVIVDVRDPKEVPSVIPGAIRVHVSRVADADLPEGELWVHCRSGYRSAVAASLLERTGRTTVAIIEAYDRYAGPTAPA